MNLDEAQRKKVAGWIAEGLKLSEIQSRLASELELRLTYMDVRLLVDDLKLTPKDPEPVKAPVLPAPAPAALPPPPPRGGPLPSPAPGLPGLMPSEPAPSAAGGVTLGVDQIARPGAMVSGKVTFSDGIKADWYLDQTGRLGLVPQQPGYRPPQADLQQFQAALESELSRMGF